MVDKESKILNYIKAAIEKARNEFSSEIPTFSDKEICEHGGCVREVHAKNLCNIHYNRVRLGLDVNMPLKVRKKNGVCNLCGEVDTKGVWGFCRNHYRQMKYKIIKDAVISAMGGRCEHCGGVFHRSVYDFHHLNVEEKDKSPAAMLKTNSPENIAKELSKCILLCANCHRVEHHDLEQELP